MILLTTSDYYPQIGGLATFTENIVKVLIDLNQQFEVFHWKSHRELSQFNEQDLQKYSMVINIHSQFCWQTNLHHPKMINFIHGSEILMTSPNYFKMLYKMLLKKTYFSRLEQSHYNIFISEASLKKAIERGYHPDFSRDLISHNAINTEDAIFCTKSIDANKWVFTCIARDVPHKNIKGAISFCEMIQEKSKREVEIIIPHLADYRSDKIAITKLVSVDDQARNEAYKRSHFNLLLSLDHSHLGFYEGFGLTVLEAAKFGTPSVVLATGGLPESVHHQKTGWVLDHFSEQEINSFVENACTDITYKKMAVNSFTHIMGSHSLDEYQRLFKSILFNKSEAA